MSLLQNDQFKLIFPQSKEEQDWMPHAETADVVVGWRPTIKFLEKATRLKLLVNPGAGVQHLQERIPKEYDFTIVNGHGNAFYTAEHAMAMLLAITNQLIPHHMWMKSGKWRLGDDDAKSFSLKDKKVGLLGYGNINQQLEKFLAPFECEVIKLKRTSTEDIYGVSELKEVLTKVEIAIIAMPSTPETKDLIGTQELKTLGQNGVLINLGRGDIVNEEAFYEALKNKVIRAAGIDVWYNYEVEENSEGLKRPYTFPFHELDNVIFSPHRAASPFDSLERWSDVIHNIKACETNQDYINVVNLEMGY